MDASSGIWGAVVAFIGLIGVLATGRRGPRELPPGTPGDTDKQLQVSPQIWMSLNSRIGELEGKVGVLERDAEAAKEREKFLTRLLRLAVAALKRANRRLRNADQPDEPVPTELLPYGAE
jgi:hypothetical protein